jgi:hypothetical protein
MIGAVLIDNFSSFVDGLLLSNTDGTYLGSDEFVDMRR